MRKLTLTKTLAIVATIIVVATIAFFVQSALSADSAAGKSVCNRRTNPTCKNVSP